MRSAFGVAASRNPSGNALVVSAQRGQRTTGDPHVPEGVEKRRFANVRHPDDEHVQLSGDVCVLPRDVCVIDQHY